MKRNQIIKFCIVCNKEFSTPPSWNRLKCCSFECSNLSRIGKPTWNKGIKTGLIPKTAFKKGMTPWNKGKIFPERSKEFSPSWKGGITKHNGYVYISQPNHPYKHYNGYVKRSRLVIEQMIRRYLTPKEVVHHINGIKDDDRPENLMYFANDSDHQKFHQFFKRNNRLPNPTPTRRSASNRGSLNLLTKKPIMAL